ncbi:MAG: AAA family ATPase [Chloroflexota bacterium]
MIIEAVQVKNFRSILNATLRCEPLTALVGSNGAGKSSFLKALKLFYDSSPDIDEDDFYDGDTDKEIEITITFKNLTDEAKTLFAGYLQDNRLVVERIITWDNGRSSSKYHGATLQNLDFQPVREAFDLKDRAKTAKERYAELHRQPLYQ